MIRKTFIVLALSLGQYFMSHGQKLRATNHGLGNYYIEVVMSNDSVMAARRFRNVKPLIVRDTSFFYMNEYRHAPGQDYKLCMGMSSMYYIDRYHGWGPTDCCLKQTVPHKIYEVYTKRFFRYYRVKLILPEKKKRFWVGFKGDSHAMAKSIIDKLNKYSGPALNFELQQ